MGCVDGEAEDNITSEGAIDNVGDTAMLKLASGVGSISRSSIEDDVGIILSGLMLVDEIVD